MKAQDLRGPPGVPTSVVISSPRAVLESLGLGRLHLRTPTGVAEDAADLVSGRPLAAGGRPSALVVPLRDSEARGAVPRGSLPASCLSACRFPG